MPIALHCFYRPGGVQDRLHIRDVHVEYMIRHQALIQSGGAIMDVGGIVGMYLMLRTEDKATVDKFLESEPYHCALLFQRVERLTVDQFIPEPRQGFLEDLLVESRRTARELALSKGRDK